MGFFPIQRKLFCMVIMVRPPASNVVPKNPHFVSCACVVPPHTASGLIYVTSRTVQKWQCVTSEARSQKALQLLPCPLNHSLWGRQASKPWGHSSRLRRDPSGEGLHPLTSKQQRPASPLGSSASTPSGVSKRLEPPKRPQAGTA